MQMYARSPGPFRLVVVRSRPAADSGPYLLVQLNQLNVKNGSRRVGQIRVHMGGLVGYGGLGMTLQDRYDDAMFDFSQGEFDLAIGKLKAIVAEDPNYFDAQLSLGMAYY